MNSLLKIAALAIFVCSCGKDKRLTADIPCIPNGLSGHVLAFYPFANGSLDDASGNNNQLTNTGGAVPTSDRNGNSNCAFSFNNTGPSSQFLTNNSPGFLNNLSQFSVSLWYEVTVKSPVGNYVCLISRDSGNVRCPDKMGQWSVGLYDCGRAVFGRTNSVWEIMTDFNDCPLPINKWHHVVATYNSSGTVMSIYKDGVLQESKSGNGDCGSAVANVAQDIGNLFLGRDFSGKLDDVILFNKALNQQEVTSLFTMESCCL